MRPLVEALRFFDLLDDEIEHLEQLCWEHRRRKHPPDCVRFAGFYHISPEGEFIVASQHLDLNVPNTAPLVFTLKGQTVPGVPGGSVTTSDPTLGTPTLSTDGLSVNMTMTATGTATLTYAVTLSDGTVLTATVDVTDQPVVTLPDAVGFGTFAPGTTA